MGEALSTKMNAANSGIEAILGFEFQRNCALHLLLSNYANIKDREFFLCIEHHDDFLFCYRSDCLSKIEEIHSYQAKKLSASIWTIDQRFTEIIAKLLDVGNNLLNDLTPKSQNYSHKLTFISNSDIKLNYKPSTKEKSNGKEEISHIINEQNSCCKYNEIPQDIKNKIHEKLNDFCTSQNIKYYNTELENMHIEWVDFPRTNEMQKNVLVGLMSSKFSHVNDPSAAIELLLNLFRKVETTYNQKKIISLLDKTKRVEGNEIKKAIEIIETEQKAFKLWREYSTTLSQEFRVPIGIQKNHENYIKNTFELLKDMSNNEHQIIKNFVRKHNYSMRYHSYHQMFSEYLLDIKNNHSTNLSDIDIFFSILCSFVEHHDESL